jgi:sugar lactone lactonase YvrE
MKTKTTETTFESTIDRAGQLISRIACLGVVLLICSSASAQNLFVSGSDAKGGEIFKLTWDAKQNIFASGLGDPWDLAFDGAGNLFVVDSSPLERIGDALIYRVTPNGVRTIFASGLSYPSDLAVDKRGHVFVADYNHGIIYEYKPTGTRTTFATGLHHPVGLVFDSLGNLFVADNNAGNLYQGSIYKYEPSGSRSTFALLERADRPADLAFDMMGNLFMADLGGNIYRYDMGALRRYRRTTFGSVLGSAQSLAFDGAGNLFVVAVGENGPDKIIPNAIYKFPPQGGRSMFISAQARGQTFSHVAFEPMGPVCCDQAYLPVPVPTPEPRPTPPPRSTS